jgi:hypothetical protein
MNHFRSNLNHQYRNFHIHTTARHLTTAANIQISARVQRTGTHPTTETSGYLTVTSNVYVSANV